MKILIIEDDPSLQEIIKKSLEKERYVVETADNYQAALLKLDDYDYDCILLDIMLPGEDGYSILDKLKKSSGTMDIMLPGGSGLQILESLKREKRKENVIIISAKDSLEDKVAGLDLGADDYLAKPFHLAELNARIKSVIRRNNHGGEKLITLDNIEINPATFEVKVDQQPIDLNRKEYDILLYFINRPNRLINKQTLAESVWGDHIDQVDNFDFIYAQIKNLRKKLKEAGANPEIKAVYGIGYKLNTNI